MSAYGNNKQLIWKIKSFQQLSTEELYQILQARIDVFVVEQQCPYREADGDDPFAMHIWAEYQSQIVAYCRVFPAAIKYPEASIGRVLTQKNFRQHGYGKILMHLAIQAIAGKFGISQIRISAQDYLIPFYKSLGFQSTGKSYLEDDIPHTEMLKSR